MVQTFVTQVKDEVKHRIVIDKPAWDLEGLQKGDYIKVTIEKVQMKNK